MINVTANVDFDCHTFQTFGGRCTVYHMIQHSQTARHHKAISFQNERRKPGLYVLAQRHCHFPLWTKNEIVSLALKRLNKYSS